MNFSSKFLEQAVNAFASLPGVGRKSALRLSLHFLEHPEELTEDFTRALMEMKKNIHTCEVCYNLSDAPVCAICTNNGRKQNLICVVENVRQVMAIEDTGQYSGTYHVLGGVIAPIEGIGPEQLTIFPLIDRVANLQEEQIEVILALSPTIEGETTNLYLAKQLEPYGVKISTIARGVSFGSDIQYADELTLSRSIMARLPYDSAY